MPSYNLSALLDKNINNDNKRVLANDLYSDYLTKREKEVLKYVVLGYTAKRIGKTLHISFRTVEGYVDKLKLKLRCDTKSELIEKVIVCGLIAELNLV